MTPTRQHRITRFLIVLSLAGIAATMLWAQDAPPAKPLPAELASAAKARAGQAQWLEQAKQQAAQWEGAVGFTDRLAREACEKYKPGSQPNADYSDCVVVPKAEAAKEPAK